MPPKRKTSKQDQEEIITEEEINVLPELELDEPEPKPRTRKYIQDVDPEIKEQLSKIPPTIILSYLYAVGADQNCPNHSLREGAWRTIRDMSEGGKPKTNNGGRGKSRTRQRDQQESSRNADWGEPVRGRDRRSRSRTRSDTRDIYQ